MNHTTKEVSTSELRVHPDASDPKDCGASEEVMNPIVVEEEDELLVRYGVTQLRALELAGHDTIEVEII